MMTQPAETVHPHPPLNNRALAVIDSPVSGYAHRLLASLGAITPASSLDLVAAQALWAHSGAMALTGHHEGPPLACPAPLAACLQACCDALQTLAPRPFSLSAAPLLGERAAIAGHRRQGAISAGSSCRLLATADSAIALNIARDDDWSLLPALLNGVNVHDWQSLATALRQHATAELCEKTSLLGLAAAPLNGEQCKRRWYEIAATGPQRDTRGDRPLVIDLSSLWAGPLCGHLLQLAGARVIKVESLARPDGARRGPPAFFDLLNAGKSSVALDLGTPAGIAQLRELLLAADIVIESSRPRALQHMGIVVEEVIAQRAGLTWVSITGFGRTSQQALRVAYGDDAGVAAGLSALLQQHHGVMAFCGDAIADPLTGAHAALAALAGWSSGGGYLFDISLQAVVADCMRAAKLPCGEVRKQGDNWTLYIDQQRFPVLAPRSRAVHTQARTLGADTAALCRELALPC